MKTCTECNAQKENSQFYKKSEGYSRPGSFMSRCKDCHNKYNEKYRSLNKDVIKQRIKAKRTQITTNNIQPAPEEPASAYSLYVLRNPLIPGMVKIGKAKCAVSRALDLSVSQPFELLVCYAYSGWGGLETQMHHKLEHIRVTSGRGREWFWMEPENADMLIRAAILEREIATQAWTHSANHAGLAWV